MSDPIQKTYKIGQAAKAIGVEPYVLRFWETEFPQLVPCRKPSGQRFYTQEHIDLLNRIKKLLYEDKLTIEGARIRLRNESRWSGLLHDIKSELEDLKSLLEKDS